MGTQTKSIREQSGYNNRIKNIFIMESLILAQNERWRHGLGMQVEREVPSFNLRKETRDGKWRKGE